MRSSFLIVSTLGIILLLGAGCTSNNQQNNNSATIKLEEKDPEYLKDQASYFFIVENRENNWGNTSQHAILSVRKNCDNFEIIPLTKNQPIKLSEYTNKAILFKKYELHGQEYTLIEIKKNSISEIEIDKFKKACPDPFGRYMASSVPLTGVHLYVESLEQSSKNILTAMKQFNIVEYKPPELTDKNQIKIFFLTVPNSKYKELEALLQKEANDKIVYGAKIFFGDLGGEIERAEFGTTNFEIKLISLSIL